MAHPSDGRCGGHAKHDVMQPGQGLRVLGHRQGLCPGSKPGAKPIAIFRTPRGGGTRAGIMGAHPGAPQEQKGSVVSTKQAIIHAQELMRCRSVTPEEAGALRYLGVQLSAAGFTCHRLPFSEQGTPDVENLYARIGTGSPHICFAGHIDVVPPGDEAAWRHPPFAAEIEDGVLYGRGAADMKGGIAASLAAVLRFLSERGAAFAGSISFLNHRRRGRPGHKRNPQGCGLAGREGREAGCLPSWRMHIGGSGGRYDQDRPARFAELPAQGTWRARACRLPR